MKFIQFGDLHLDTPINKKYFKKEEYDNAIKAFFKIIDICNEEDVDFLLITGDLFDSEYISKNTLELVRNKLRSLGDKKVFISPGNHDSLAVENLYKYLSLDNIYIFKEFSHFDLIKNDERVRIYGAGFTSPYQMTSLVPEELILDRNFFNLLSIHGEIKGQSDYNPMFNNIRDFDYVALGHIHQFIYNPTPQLRYAYSGTPLGRGFDEEGEKGIILGEINGESIEIQFIKLGFPIFETITLDISDMDDGEIVKQINSLDIDKNNKYRIIFIGNRRNGPINAATIMSLIKWDNYIKIYDETKVEIDYSKTFDANGLIGMFINRANEVEEDIREEVIKTGLDALLRKGIN